MDIRDYRETAYFYIIDKLINSYNIILRIL
jgi:hypothetical protein